MLGGHARRPGLLRRPDREIGFSGYVPQDVVQAAPGFRTGASRFQSNASADLLLAAVREQSRTIGELAERLRDAFGLDEEQARVDVARFVRSANTAGLISVKGPLHTEMYYSGVRRLQDFWVAQYAGPAAMLRGSRRDYRDPTASNLLTAILSVHLRIAMLVVVPFAVFYFYPREIAASELSQWWTFSFIFGAMIVILGVLTLIHEGLHMLAARVTGVPGISVYRSGLVVGFQRARTTPAREIAISVAGPLGAAVVGGVLSVVVMTHGAAVLSPIGLPHRLLLLVLVVAVVYHLIALTPIAQDGRVIKRTIHALTRGDET